MGHTSKDLVHNHVVFESKDSEEGITGVRPSNGSEYRSPQTNIHVTQSKLLKAVKIYDGLDQTASV